MKSFHSIFNELNPLVELARTLPIPPPRDGQGWACLQGGTHESPVRDYQLIRTVDGEEWYRVQLLGDFFLVPESVEVALALAPDFQVIYYPDETSSLIAVPIPREWKGSFIPIGAGITFLVRGVSTIKYCYFSDLGKNFDLHMKILGTATRVLSADGPHASL